MEVTALGIAASSILFGFFFAGFWWALNRELEFEEKARHFKLAYILLLLSMAVLACFGIIAPLASASHDNVSIVPIYRGVFVALVGIFGYMLTELAHYRVFRRPGTTPSERVFFALTIAVMLLLFLIWAL